MDVIDVILWIKTFRTSNGLVLSQSYYVEKVLNKFSKEENSIVKTPKDISVYLFKNKSKGIDKLDYSWKIRSLIYVINCTRPDIAYLVNKLSRFTGNSRIDQWKTMRRVLRY